MEEAGERAGVGVNERSKTERDLLPLSFRTGFSREESAVSTTLSPAFVIDELAAPRILTFCHSEPASAVRNLLLWQKKSATTFTLWPAEAGFSTSECLVFQWPE